MVIEVEDPHPEAQEGGEDPEDEPAGVEEVEEEAVCAHGVDLEVEEGSPYSTVQG